MLQSSSFESRLSSAPGSPPLPAPLPIMAYAADHPPVSPPPPPPRRLEPPAFAMPKVELVRAVHRYEQQEDGDLSIEPGDV
eukprot:CAMPEP_0118885510 /NCGR_PEP_ID=MMETSP1163-20130328/23956_1 /TAXON_ID=124430 /ORGANISM="Phaeomonas parva, Strain CCMP2877" /LENGTH=80 /DNA_ID=CAMNT_0006823537 /DNA_START=214 /DNA_END=452 /DNA_ORIENTATION=-